MDPALTKAGMIAGVLIGALVAIVRIWTQRTFVQRNADKAYEWFTTHDEWSVYPGKMGILERSEIARTHNVAHPIIISVPKLGGKTITAFCKSEKYFESLEALQYGEVAFTCSECGEALTFSKAHSGSVEACPRCKARILVPS